MSSTVQTKDASGAETREDWLALIEEIGDEAGYFETLGKDHWAFFVDESPTLIVTFETLDSIRQGADDQMPLGHHIARAGGWSHLCLIAGKESWYRDRAVYGYFDRLVDDAFFEDFDRVVFFGAGMGGYAAAAFSVAAPGSTVIVAAPQATLDPRIAGWDSRFRAQRRLNFNDRYGFAPDMTEGAGDVFVIFDPESHLDAMHAALFRRPFTAQIRVPGFGSDPAEVMQRMNILAPLLIRAGEGRLTAGDFHRHLRGRHSYLPYLRGLLARADRRALPILSGMVCRAVLRAYNAPRFRRRLAAIETELDAAGLALPEPRERG